MSNEQEPKVVGSIYCRLVIPDTMAFLSGDDNLFMEQTLELMTQPIDPDAPNTSCFH